MNHRPEVGGYPTKQAKACSQRCFASLYDVFLLPSFQRLEGKRLGRVWLPLSGLLGGLVTAKSLEQWLDRSGFPQSQGVGDDSEVTEGHCSGGNHRVEFASSG